MQRSGDATRWLLLRAVVVTVAVFVFWLLVAKDVGAAAPYAAFLGGVDVIFGFGFRAWRKRRPVETGDFWDPFHDEGSC